MATRADFEVVTGRSQNVEARARIENLRRQVRGQTQRGNIVAQKRIPTELYLPGEYDDRKSWLLGSFLADQEREFARSSSRSILAPIDPFPREPTKQVVRPGPDQAAFQAQLTPANQSVPRFDVNNAHPGLDPASNYGLPGTIGILLGVIPKTRKPDIPIWARDAPDDL